MPRPERATGSSDPLGSSPSSFSTAAAPLCLRASVRDLETVSRTPPGEGRRCHRPHESLKTLFFTLRAEFMAIGRAPDLGRGITQRSGTVAGRTRMPAPFPPSAGGFAAISAIAGPLMMLAMAFSRPGPVRALLKAEADAPERARRAASLDLREEQLAPLLKSGVVVREADGCMWVDRAKARRRSWRIAGTVGGVLAAIGGTILFVLSIGG